VPAFFWNALFVPWAFTLGAISKESKIDHLWRSNNVSMIKLIAMAISKMLNKKAIEDARERITLIAHLVENCHY
jgi:hypothetical protein